MIILAITLGINVILCLTMLFRGHSVRYRVLFYGLVWMICQALILRFVYVEYGTNSFSYSYLWHAGKFSSIIWTIGIIVEGFRWRNLCVIETQALYLIFLTLAYFRTKNSGVDVHIVYELLRWSNVIATAWLVYCFRNPSPTERKKFYEPRTRAKEGA